VPGVPQPISPSAVIGASPCFSRSTTIALSTGVVASSGQSAAGRALRYAEAPRPRAARPQRADNSKLGKSLTFLSGPDMTCDARRGKVSGIFPDRATVVRMSETKPNPTPRARTFTTTAPIEACRLRRDDLARLYRIINDRQIEYGQMFVDQVLAQLPTESSEQFQERRARVKNSFVTTVNVTGSNNEIVSGSGEHFLASGNIPDSILTVFYTTIAGPNAVGIAQEFLQNRATLLIDFSRPTILDFTKLPTFATPNNSNFEISASSEAWFTTLNTRLTELFRERRTGFNWLHQPGIYDLLLFVLGLPFALWIDFRCSPIIDRLQLPTVLGSGIFVYLFVAGLFIFRGIFTYSRWVFPKVEIQSEGSPPLRHRAVWAAIMIGVFGGAVWDSIKALW
jgi:hypothetical protein